MIKTIFFLTEIMYHCLNQINECVLIVSNLKTDDLTVCTQKVVRILLTYKIVLILFIKNLIFIKGGQFSSIGESSLK